MTGRIARALAATALVLLPAVGCGREDEPRLAPAPAAPAGAADDGIAWFQGSVEEAFAVAKRERRPVFLYWGAVWCPPCHALRVKIFPRPEIRARLAGTVAVYLDGDTERAQIWGEKLGTLGYPTVIVLDADGREVTRLPSLLPVAEYADLLARALDAARPVAELLAAAEANGAASLAPAELSLLAFYAWNQDTSLRLDAARRAELFARFRSETPTDRALERARFLALELAALSELEEAPVLSEERRRERSAELRALLADPAARDVNLDLVLYRARPVVLALTPVPGPDRDVLVAAWTAAARAIEGSDAHTVDDRLVALAPQLALATLDGDEESAPERVPEELRARVRERVRWAAGEVHDEDELQAVVSTMADVLDEAGLTGEAKTLLADRLDETLAPYYFVGYLAALEAKTGQPECAVALYRDAWQQARAAESGAGMTPFRWGSRYLQQAMKLTPAASAAIAADARVILAELLAGPDAFAGGNWSRLSPLASALEQWRAGDPAARQPVLEAVRGQVQAACGGLPDEGPDSAAARCRSFLAQG